jgi:Ca-activated chloride channel family protein
MRHASIFGLGLGCCLVAAGCARNLPPQVPATTEQTSSPAVRPAVRDEPREPSADEEAAVASDHGAEPASGAWLGAAAEGDLLLTGTVETSLGVWVDIPDVPHAHPARSARPPLDVALVIDTSGSMAGAKIDNARQAATKLVTSLRDGDIVALDTFSDTARTVIPPTRLDAESRRVMLQAIRSLGPSGSTNMFDALNLAERQMGAAPPSHALRRVVMISDGIANVGPSSPETLGAIAERGTRFRAQVTSLGVGNDYDERTLNALAVRSSGRLYHLTEPREMAAILKGELDLLDATVASDAVLEVVPAAGVQLLGADGVRTEWGGSGTLRIPLGALHAGQHREALVRVRLTDPGVFEGNDHALASVRLRFRDARDSDLERVQETVARTQLTTDAGAVARHVSSRTKAIALIQDAARLELTAAQRINEGAFSDADKELARAEKALASQADAVTAPEERKRIAVAQSQVAAARASARAMPSKPKAAQRVGALELNASGMKSLGY